MNMRTVNDPYGGNAPLVDKFIGNAYDTVRYVALNLAYVKHVSYHMKEVYDVAHNMLDVLNVSKNMADVNTVASISTQVKLLAAQIDGLVSLANNLPALLNIDENIAALIDLDKNVDNLVDLHSHQAEYLAVYEKLPAIETIIPKLEEIGAVFDNLTQVVAVGDNITAVKNVNDNMAKILSVEAELALINKVADDVEALVAEIAAVETGIYAKFAAPDGLKNVGQVATWAALSTTVPTVAGQRVFLKEYAAGTGFGGGMMVAVNSAGTEDGGYRASVNANWHWRRDLTDLNELNVIHFGAIPDNTTDAMPAILRMDNFSLAQTAPYNRIGIQFPLGRFAVSTMDVSGTYRSFFRLVGSSHSVFGYMSTTQLKLIGADDSVAFKIQSRYTELANIQVIGQFDVDGKIRHWVKNICQAGQYVRGTCLQFTQHGRGVDMLDTLDVKFDQIYSSRGQNNVLRTLASGNTNGSWTHSTAFELTNFNIQYHEATEELKGALMLPNCGQSLIYNGWIEHSVQPGNLTKGQWMVQSLSMESSTNPLYMSQSRFINLLFSNPNNAGIDTETNKCVDPITGEYNNGSTSAYERGYVYINTYGARFIAPVKYERLSYFKRVSNITAASKWIYVGHFFMPGLAFNATLKINGRTGYGSVAGDTPASQEACIRIQNRGTTSNTVTWEGTPTGPILAVKYEQRYNNDTYVYIQVPAYSAIGIQLEGMGQTREETGTPAFVDWDMSEVADITAVANLSDAVQAYRAGTRAANIAFNGSTGVISLTGSGQTITIGELTSFLMTLNGTVTAIPMIGDGTVKLPVFYYSALPPASSMYWRIVILRGYFTCTDGNTYNTQPVFSDGTNWRPCQVPGTSVNGVIGG